MRYLTLATLLFAAVAATAQVPDWTRSEDALIGYVRHFASDTAGTLYALTSDGVHRSIDDGVSWSRGMYTIRDATFGLLAVDHLRGEVFAAAIDSGIHRSTDAGATWQYLGGPTRSWLTSIAVSPGASELLVSANDGLHRSTDRGASWMPAVLRQSVSSVLLLPFSVLAVVDTGILRSTASDRSTWDPVFANAGADRVTSLVETAAGSIVAGRLNRGIIRSTDGGGTWRPATIESSSASILTVRRGRGAELLATTTTMQLLRSTDDGATWQNVASTAPIDGIHRSRSGRLFTRGRWGLFASDDDGATWRRSDDGINSANITSLAETRSGVIFAMQPYGRLHRSTDTGLHWTHVDTVTTRDGVRYARLSMLTIEPASNALYATTGNNGVIRSTDEGVTWDALASAPQEVDGLGALPGGRAVVISGESIHVSTDTGATWRSTQALPDGFNILSMAELGDALFAASAIGVFRSVGGGPWERVSTETVYSLLAGPDGALYAGADGRIDRSTDNGTTWTTATSVGPTFVLSLVAGANGRIVAGLRHGGTYMWSRASGWLPKSSGLFNSQIASLLITREGRLLAGTYGGGVFRYWSSFAGIDEGVRPAASLLAYPNPARTEITLHIELHARATIVVELFDATGRRVLAKSEHDVSPGASTLGIDVSTLPAGVYLCRLTGGDVVASQRIVVSP